MCVCTYFLSIFSASDVVMAASNLFYMRKRKDKINFTTALETGVFFPGNPLPFLTRRGYIWQCILTNCVFSSFLFYDWSSYRKQQDIRKKSNITPQFYFCTLYSYMTHHITKQNHLGNIHRCCKAYVLVFFGSFKTNKQKQFS